MYVNEEAEQPDGEEEEIRILDDKIKPDHALFFQNDIERSLSTIHKLSEEEAKGTHYNEKDTTKRYKIWEKHNISSDGSPILQDFYIENNICHFSIDTYHDKNEIKECLKIFIERNGKYNNYQTHDEREEQERLAKFMEANAEKEAEAQKYIDDMEQKQVEDKKLIVEELR